MRGVHTVFRWFVLLDIMFLKMLDVGAENK